MSRISLIFFARGPRRRGSVDGGITGKTESGPQLRVSPSPMHDRVRETPAYPLAPAARALLHLSRTASPQGVWRAEGRRSSAGKPGMSSGTGVVLASASETRAQVLRNAGVAFTVEPANIDEAALKTEHRVRGSRPEDAALALAVAKAREVAALHPGALVIGADQLLVSGACWFDKPGTREGARATLEALRGQTHQPAPPKAAAPEKFLVFFDWDKAVVTTEGRKVIANAAEAYKTSGQATIVATGYTDLSGPPAYNYKLSERRAAAVKAELVRLGVAATSITTIGRGENDPLVPTADGVREPQNRRVEIQLQRPRS